jgi:hypothetical protein
MFILQFSPTPPGDANVAAAGLGDRRADHLGSNSRAASGRSQRCWSDAGRAARHQASRLQNLLHFLGEDALLPRREIAGEYLRVAPALVELGFEFVLDAGRAQQLGKLVEIFGLP